MKISINELKKIIKSEIKLLSEQQSSEETLQAKFYRKYNQLQSEVERVIQTGNFGKFALFINNIESNKINLIAINPEKMYEFFLTYTTEFIENESRKIIFTSKNLKSKKQPGIFFSDDDSVDLGTAMLPPTMPIRLKETVNKNIHEYPKHMFDQIDFSYKTTELIESYIGYVQIEQSNQDKPCYGSWKTLYARAVGGNGPLMYSIAASYVKKEFGSGIKNYNKITSDKRIVSSDAQDVWKKTYTQRSDYEKYELDDGTKTPDTWDDCEILGDKYLNYAYEIKDTLNYEKFISAFDLFLNSLVINISKILNSFGYDSPRDDIMKDIKKTINTYASRFFYQ